MTEAGTLAGIEPWLLDLLAHHGAMVEPQPDGTALVCLPPELQLRLALPESALLRVLQPAAEPGAIAVPLEGTVLQACLDLALERGRLAAGRLPAAAKKGDLHAACSQTLQVDNAAISAVRACSADLRWLVLELAFAAAADERSTGSVAVAHELSLAMTSREVAAALRARLAEMQPTAALPAADEVARALRQTWPVAEQALCAALQPFRRGAGERFAREQRRLVAYYDKLLIEAKRRRGRLAADPAAVRSKQDAIVRDLEHKRAEMTERFAVRCAVEIASALAVSFTTSVAEFCVRRRTRERTVAIAWDPWLRAPLPLSCEACALPSRVFRACDDRVHLVCPACAAPRCPVCVRDGSQPR